MTPQDLKLRKDQLERLWPKVDFSEPSGCWRWTATISSAGYGMFYIAKGEPILAHRLMYQLLLGPIPTGLVIDHLCRNRWCVNPIHMEPVTHRENILRGAGPSARQARQTHCQNGHPFEGENLVRWGGKRRCRTCHNEWQRTKKRRPTKR